MAETELHELAVKDIGKSVRVPVGEAPHLMYYLASVASLVSGIDIPYKFTNFRKWGKAFDTVDDVWEMIRLAQKFNPEVMTKAGIFIECEVPLTRLGKTCMFVEITDTRYPTLPSATISVGGTQVTCVQRLLYTNEWLVENYKLPMRVLGHWDGKYCYKPTVLARGKRCDVQ